MTASRRVFLQRLGAMGGYGAVYGAMHALGLAPSSAAAAPMTPSPDAGRGKRVVVLGGGIAGLVSTYELERSGFTVTLLEARERLGGRNWTLRGGDKVEMMGEADQTVGFSDGVYMNAGPARLPSHHQGVLGYCKALGVPLEVEVNASRSAFVWSEKSNGGKPIQMRQGINDTRGHVAELLAKAVNQGALDQAMSAEDKARLLPFLKFYGDLADDMSFGGSERSGCSQYQGAADQFTVKRKPLPLHELLANEQIRMTLFEDVLDMQATMFQPVGGMDRIPAGFERAIKSPIVRGAEVQSIRTPHGRAEVTFVNRRTGVVEKVEADYLVVTIPLIILDKIDNDFDKPVKAAIAAVPYDHSNKIGFEAPRFWEQDDQIYGGISFVGGDTSLIWYPSANLHSARGMLLGCYTSGPQAKAVATQPLDAQIASAKLAISRVHPGREALLEKPIVINWNKIPFNQGPWPHWPGQGSQEGIIDTPEFRLLNEPHGPVYFAGAHLSQMPGWQEGAVLSAQRAVTALVKRAAEEPVKPAAKPGLLKRMGVG